MNNQPVLSQIALGFGVVVDARRQVLAHRLNVAAARPDVAVDVGDLLELLPEVWPEGAPPNGAATSLRKGSVVLNVSGEALLLALLEAQAARPLASVIIEVPAFALREQALSRATRAAHEAGCRLWAKGRAAAEAATALKGWFSHCAYDLPEAPPAHRGAVPAVACGANTISELDDAVRRGASLVTGWPLVEVQKATATAKKVAPELQVVMDLIGRIDREEPVERLEATLKNDPSLAFRLLRYLNSAAFGLSVEITSFRHALMMLGYAKLKRWLALLLVSASKDPNQLPVMHAAVRRGLLMEELGRSLGDAEMRGELFLCGVFSLLDRMLQQPFAELFRSVSMPERVRQALGEQAGPFMPYLNLVAAVEKGSPFDVQEAADTLLLDGGEVNRSLFAALGTARQLEA